MDDIDVIIFIRKQNIDLLKNVKSQNIQILISRFAGMSRFARVLWEQTILPFILIAYKVDVLFCPGNIAPIFSPVKSIVWIGTIGPFLKSFIEHFSAKERFELYINKYVMIASARSANAVIFESNYTKELFLNNYGIDKKKSHVINIGKDVYYTSNKTDLNSGLINKYKIFEPYILCVSHLYPYKNILNMLSAFSIAQKQTGNQYKLLIAGGIINTNYHKKIQSQINNHSLQKSVFLLNTVAIDELQYLYKRCHFLIFPSPYENFAYTLVEAMSCGTPIICSNTTAMPETCQEAAIYFDPKKTEEIAEKIELVINDKDLRKSLSQKSLERVKELPNYEEVTFKTFKIMKNLIAEN
tara:strand:- start:5640 stop:6704 length:1065 start_codon:yes stop_codon:yes gene_type:complete